MKKHTINFLLATVFATTPLFAMEPEEGDNRSFVPSTAPSAMETELSSMETLDFTPTSQMLDYLDARSCLRLQVTSRSMQQKIEEYKKRAVSVLDNPDQSPDKEILRAIGFLSLEARAPYYTMISSVFDDVREAPEDRQLAAALLPDERVRARLAIGISEPYGTGSYDNISLVNILKRFPVDDEVRLGYIRRNHHNLEYLKLFPSGYDRSGLLINYIYRLDDSPYQHSNPLDLQIQAAQILAQEREGNGLFGTVKENLWHIQNELFRRNLSSTQIIQVAELLLPKNYPNPLSSARGEKLLKLAKDGAQDSNIRRKAANLLADSDIKTQLLQELSSLPSSMEEVDSPSAMNEVD